MKIYNEMPKSLVWSMILGASRKLKFHWSYLLKYHALRSKSWTKWSAGFPVTIVQVWDSRTSQKKVKSINVNMTFLMHVFRSIQEAWIPLMIYPKYYNQRYESWTRILMGFIVNIVPVLAFGTSQKKVIAELPTWSI